MGRRSKLPALLDDGIDGGRRGLRLHLLHALLPRRAARRRARPLITPFESFSVLTLPADNGHLVGDAVRRRGRPAAEGASRHEAAFDRRRAARARCTRTGSRASRSPACWRWAACIDRRRRIDPARVDRASRCWATRGRARTPRSAAACRSRLLARRAAARARRRPRRRSPRPRSASSAPWYDATVAGDRARLAEMDRGARRAAPTRVPADPASRLRAALPLAAGRRRRRVPRAHRDRQRAHAAARTSSRGPGSPRRCSPRRGRAATAAGRGRGARSCWSSSAPQVLEQQPGDLARRRRAAASGVAPSMRS